MVETVDTAIKIFIGFVGGFMAGGIYAVLAYPSYGAIIEGCC